jgi:hypothetical protein
MQRRTYRLSDSNKWSRFGKFGAGSTRDRIVRMAKLTLVYGMRLLPSEDIQEVGDATVKLTNGREVHVTSHVVEGSKEEIQKQLQLSINAFFDLYPEI